MKSCWLLLFITMILTLLAINGCMPSPSGQEPGTSVLGPEELLETAAPTPPYINGRITLDGHPQEGASVSTQYGSAVSDASGMYFLKLSAPVPASSQVRFEVRTRAGYRAFFDRFIAAEEKELQMDFALYLSPTALINVIEPDGQAIQNAAVTLQRTGRSDSRILTTGGDGRVQFDNLEEGIYTLRAEKNGYVFSETRVEVTMVGVETVLMAQPIVVELNRQDLHFAPGNDSLILTMTAPVEVVVQVLVEALAPVFLLTVEGEEIDDATKIHVVGTVAVRVTLYRSELPQNLRSTNLTVVWPSGTLTMPITIE
jgi:hypothetical protein